MYIIWDHVFRYVCSIVSFFVCCSLLHVVHPGWSEGQTVGLLLRANQKHSPAAPPSYNTFVTLFSNGRVHLCKLDHANPQPSQSLNNTLNALLPNSNKSLMETHTLYKHSLPSQMYTHTHTHTHRSKPPEGEFNGFFYITTLSVDRPVEQLMSPTLLLVPFFFPLLSSLSLSLFGLAQTCGRAGRGRLRRSLLSGQSRM